MRILLLAGVFVLAFATPAAAHPFGPPSTARLAVDGSTVSLSWLAAEDDWVALGQSLGAFDGSAAVTGEEQLRRSPAVRDYLLARVTVSQGGRACPGELAPLADLTGQGARYTFHCPASVAELDVRVSALTDLNSAYRTVVTADAATPARGLLTAAEDTLRVRFSGSGGLPGSVVGLAAGLAVLVAVVVAVGLVVLVRRRRA
ncbi:hypothetical protein BLA60_00155 [Actinophytocola xinjiangensis]|uniref:PE-PGRS family protein n=1 Tax=Actinophytocola xinjiangensis TaxID=485602 RepID=A0A7Z0WRT0_9PSEU|nr:hypothetical protein [Actinophytocola xinjiangensis]OLF13662.1 hypothetical protein BLA60_00155 [Actinophytocola xinjiangensis]